MACSSSMTNDEIKHRILINYTKFVSDVEPDRLSDWLVQEEVITIDERQRIRNTNHITSDRCRALLDHLFAIHHPKAFVIVREALSERNHHLLKYIDKQESECEFHEQPDTETSSQGKTKLQQLEKDYVDQKRAWEAEKDRLLKMQKELEGKLQFDKKKIEQLEKDNEDQKRAWKEEKDRLLKIQKDLEAKLSLGKTKLQQPGKDFEDQKKAWEAERDRLLKLKKELETNLHGYRKKIEQLKKDNEDQKRAWEEEKDRLLKIQEEHEDQKRAWEAEKDRLLKMQKDLETKLNLDKLRYKSDPVLVQTIRTKAAEEGEKPIIGLTVLDKELFVVSEKSSEVEVYDSIKFSFNRRWNLRELICPRDAVSCNRNKCLYINDYKGSGLSKEILRIDPNGTLIKIWSTSDDYGWGLSVTYESNVILTDYNKNKLIEYSPEGQLIREVILSSIVGIRNPRHAIKLSNGHFVVSHGWFGDDLHRVCIVDADGNLKKSFGGKRGSDLGQMNSPVYMAVDGNGFVMVVDRCNHRVLLLDPDLEFKRIILSKAGKHGLRNPFKILLDESSGRLFVADNAWDSNDAIFTDGRILILDFN